MSCDRKGMKGELLDAFHAGNVDKVLYLARHLPEHAKANIPLLVLNSKETTHRYPPLIAAIVHGNYHFCKFLIELGESLAKDFTCHPCPLSLALQENHSDIAELLIASGADVKATGITNGTTYPMYYAINHSYPPSIIEQIILAGFPVDEPVIITDNLSALQCASLSNNIEAAKILVKYKANLNAVNLRGESAITIAVKLNFLDMVKFLVSKGAKLSNRKTAICPLFLAIRMEYLKMVELLLDMGASIKEGWVAGEIVSPLQFASSYLNIPIIKLLINKGADVNVKNTTSKETPLHVTSSYIGLKYTGKTLAYIQTKIAKILIDKGACVNVKDCSGRTPLDYAVYSENTELCKLLLKEGADISRKDYIHELGMLNNRFEYITCVRAFTCAELIKLCLERGCDYNYRDKHGLSPYHCVMAKHNPQMVKLFWQHGCPYDQPELIPGKMKSMLGYDPDPADKEIFAIQSEFFKGVEESNSKLVKRALQKGAEPVGCSMKIQSTLHYVVENGNHEIIKLLLEYGVPVNKINKEGQTPLYIAVKNKDLQICTLLLQFGACFNYKKSIKEKSLKGLAKENNSIYSLFKIIYNRFKMAKEGNLKLLTTLKQCVIAGNLNLLKILLNCINNQGLSLAGTASASGHLQLAKELMILRIENTF